MKTCFAIAAVAALVSLDSASAMKSFLAKFPNGDAGFTQALGHVSDSDTGLNDLGKLYSKSGGTWATMCKETFPGASMTLGEAFGDPCCKWTGSGAAEQKVTAFVKPTTKTTCAANAAPSTAPAAAPSSAPAPAPAAGPSSAPAAAPSTAPAAASKAPAAATPAPAPASKPNLRPGDKCGVKSDGNAATQRGNAATQRGNSAKESKSLEDETDDDDDVFDY